MTIIPYHADIHDQLVDIWHRAVRQTHSFLSEEDIQFYHQMVREAALTSVEVQVALNENREPVGFIGTDGQMIEMLFIDPDYHGQGIGKQLLNHIIEQKGSDLTVDVNEQNDGAKGFYEHYGFVQTGRSELDGSGRPFPLLHMKLQR
ncbi:acetyltransferase [Paenibacillus pinihumi]|uniref:acetyltransferase n=1 Tax=Paenibacillus pinihumi TaxID=669462 RepID=UPI00042A6367|nr:acetyltransferase [Paenibacillus pinihumi]